MLILKIPFSHSLFLIRLLWSKKRRSKNPVIQSCHFENQFQFYQFDNFQTEFSFYKEVFSDHRLNPGYIKMALLRVQCLFVKTSQIRHILVSGFLHLTMVSLDSHFNALFIICCTIEAFKVFIFKSNPRSGIFTVSNNELVSAVTLTSVTRSKRYVGIMGKF